MTVRCDRGIALAGLAIVLLGSVLAASAADWPTFRGPDRTGVSSETGLLKEWPKDGPELVWKKTGVGRGYSSLAIEGGRIFTLGDGRTEDDKNEYLMAFGAIDGELLWEAKTGAPWVSGKDNWQSSRSTPSTDGKAVFVITPHGVLVACHILDGGELWRKDLKAEFGGKKGDGWGYSESPLIDGDLLICAPGGDDASIVALKKETGELVWKAAQPENRGAGHSSIVISHIGDVKLYVALTAAGGIGIRSGDGEVLWNYPIEKTTAVCPTPILKDDLVFFAAGYKRGGALVRQKPAEGGKVTIEEVYPMKTALANKHGGIVRIGDYIYGDSDDQGIPYCADLMSGEIKWKQRGSGKNSASFAAADGHLYIRFANGTMVLAKADPSEYKELGSFQVPGSGERPSWAHPVISDGKLYLREHDSILCFNIRK